MMNFLEKASPWSLGRKMASAPVACVLGAACMLPLLFGTTAVGAQGTANPRSYVGIWRMTVQDKRVGTLELMTYDGRLTGSYYQRPRYPGCGSYCPGEHFTRRAGNEH